ncbi:MULTISPECIES: hypothetical protein [Marinobacter]|uniref:hypothetical protein n=1 Tax=Marinobacter TaxID=2742 RepID=UPI00177CE3E9|nr:MULTISPECIES: hypothetical protein [Marinobacter]MBL3556264.1 hypothetical protein [Marinobacter sp. JB05H06]
MVLSSGKKNSLRSDTFFPAESTPTPSGLNQKDIAEKEKHVMRVLGDIRGVHS